MNCCFFLYLWNIQTVSFSLDNDVRERRNVVYFLAVYFNNFYEISEIFLRNVFSQVFIVKFFKKSLLFNGNKRKGLICMIIELNSRRIS